MADRPAYSNKWYTYLNAIFKYMICIYIYICIHHIYIYITHCIYIYTYIYVLYIISYLSIDHFQHSIPQQQPQLEFYTALASGPVAYTAAGLKDLQLELARVKLAAQRLNVPLSGWVWWIGEKYGDMGMGQNPMKWPTGGITENSGAS